ncbi:Ribokinase-like protein [Gaertneriomyces semiglobifer]|nr:Ribokinase-like protein [Gaertneriomyces semiglobifer]
MPLKGRILSVQSHVVFGYVGHKAATFPLQLLGYDVDPINTVHFSNHTGYDVFAGERLKAEELENILKGLERNGMLKTYTHLLAGYVGRASTLEAVKSYAKKLKTENDGFTFVLDPVIGDDGQMYVSSDVIPVYREMCSIADVVTPNGFEAGVLADVEIDSTATALQAADKIHSYGCPTVIITSAKLFDRQSASDTTGSDDSVDVSTLHLVTSHRYSSGRTARFVIPFPALPGEFTGTGDLFAALVLARLTGALRAPESAQLELLKKGCEEAVASMQGVLQESMKQFEERKQGRNLIEGTPNYLACHELCIIEGRKWIENPSANLKAEDI